jgi:hypothetical protein
MPISVPAMTLTEQPHFKTPPIPREFRRISASGYVNIFDLNLGNKNLRGTETMLGDWDGEYLLVAKDFYPSVYIDLQREAGERWPYRHHPRIMSNTKLQNILVRDFKAISTDAHGGINNRTCNFLYISACFLLRTDGQVSDPLPPGGLEASAPVVQWTIENMRNLTTIVAMGNDAEEALSDASITGTIRHRKLRYRKVPHPSRGALADRNAAWGRVFVSR